MFGNRTRQGFIIIKLTIIYQLLCTCASISPPPGGSKDIKAPKVLSTVPLQKSTDYLGKKIYINLDEKPDITKLKDKIVITPTQHGEFTIDNSGKTIILEFDKPFYTDPRDIKGRTFTINFQNGIKDIHEGNELKNYKLVFSTGNQIDSLAVKGKIVDGYTREPINNAVVGLYQIGDTTDPQYKKPYYLTYSSDSGKYELSNIKRGKYLIYALIDKNKNLLYDSKADKIGFIADTLRLDSLNIESLQIPVSMNDFHKPVINSLKNDAEFRVMFNEGIYNYSLKCDVKLYHELADNKKEIIFYKTDLCEDSLDVEIHALDSANNDSTYHIKVVQSTPKKFKRTKDIIISVDPPEKYAYTDSLPIKIKTTDPIIYEWDSSIILNTDSVKFSLLSLNKDFKHNSANTYYTYTYKINKRPKYFMELIIPSSKIKNTIGDTNMQRKITYKLPDNKSVVTEDQSHLNISIQTSEKHFIVELLNDKKNVISTYYNQTKIQYQNIQPGIYSLRIIIDANNNKKWDVGNYRQNRNPEQVVIFKNAATIKKNWDIDDLSISF